MKKINVFQFILLFLSFFCFFGFAVYEFYALNQLGLLVAFLFSFSLSLYLAWHISPDEEEKVYLWQKPNLVHLVFLVIFIASLWLLFEGQTTQAIVSPWEKIPQLFFVLYFFLSLLVIYFVCNKPKSYFSVISIFLFFGLSFSVAAVIYKLGYGFDPFVHEAAMAHVDQWGIITPKTFYYIGEYTPIIALHKIFNLPFGLISKYFLPLLSALLISWSLVRLNIKKQLGFRQNNLLAMFLSIVVFPCSLFIITVPQNLAYLFLGLIILISLEQESVGRKITVTALALGALSVHLIAGLPALLFVLISQYDFFKNRRFFYYCGLIVAAIILPIAFLFQDLSFAQGNWQVIAGPVNSFWDFFGLFKINIPNKESIFLNFVYLYGSVWRLMFLSFGLFGIYITRKNKFNQLFKIYWQMALAMLISFFLSSMLPFNYLVDNEKQNYSLRFLVIGAMFMWPFVILTLQYLIEALAKNKKFIRVAFWFFVSGVLVASLYFTYPRFDRYYSSRGLSTSVSDFKAVRWIDDDAKEGNYVVLANQQVSAAALQQFGFKKYYGDIFFYPIPTNTPTYAMYLEMTKSPSLKIINEARAKIGVKDVYFVLNNYWWDYKKVKEEAKFIADSYQEFDNGQTIVYKFSR